MNVLQQLQRRPYAAYSYAYPHKTAYRTLEPPIPLTEVWLNEPRDAIYCYIHIPFCEMRCGFCNLFTTAVPPQEMVDRYLKALQRQVDEVIACVEPVELARYAIGGGTPTYLNVEQLEILLDILGKLGIETDSLPGSVETSPTTATPERIAFLRAAGVHRISIGVQTFNEAEAKLLGRTQKRASVEQALTTLKASGIPCLNIDLMYGGEGQTIDSFLHSIGCALAYQPQEIYLYPLYVRPLTGLTKLDRQWDDERLQAYRVGREYLLGHGYQQISMRMFRHIEYEEAEGALYCCQTDGMLGLGCGARSYTRALHYSTQYGVQRSSVREILADYLDDSANFNTVSHGIWLDAQEQRRRYLIMSLLQVAGLTLQTYTERFGSNPLADFPPLREIADADLLEIESDRIKLTLEGLSLSDAIGAFLYSPQVQRLSEAYAWT